MPARVALAALIATGLALPAHAAASERGVTLSAGPIDVHGYQMTLLATREATAAKGSIDVHFFRARPHGHEDDDYWFGNGVRVTVGPRLAGATLTARLGRFGSARLVFAASPSRARGALPPGCRDPLDTSRAGTLHGSLTLDTHTRFFGTVRETIPLTATLRRGARPTCFPPPLARPRGISLLTGTGGGTDSLHASRPTHGTVTEAMTVQEYYPGPHALLLDALVTHTLIAHGPRSAFAAADDLRSGHVAAASPLFSGRVGFKSSSGRVGCGRPGRLRGSLLARFDSIGTFDLFGHGHVHSSLDQFPCRDR
jgi:hypothetical protein